MAEVVEGTPGDRLSRGNQHARGGAGCGAAYLIPLDESHASTSLGEVVGGSRTDDAAADDDDVRH